ncbi:hypothetical protein PQX77_008455 [Marasmius sp. AFHP31]|nr:hypothetical protein PQX77_008455 [Marasmius sp. AFHP31]
MLDIKSSHITSLNHSLHSGSSAGGPGDYCTHPPIVDTNLPGTLASPPPPSTTSTSTSTTTIPTSRKREFLAPPSTSTSTPSPSPSPSPLNPKHPSRNRNHTRRTSRNAHPILFAQLQMRRRPSAQNTRSRSFNSFSFTDKYSTADDVKALERGGGCVEERELKEDEDGDNATSPSI